MVVCPPGYSVRKSYVRTFKNNVARSGYTVRRKGTTFTVHPTQNEVYVPASCVKQTRKGNTKNSKLRKGEFLKYAYQYRLSDRLRHKALKKIVEVYGVTSVYHKLDKAAKLSERVAPDASMIFAKDRDWVHDQMM
jgi:hypothetical protein